MITMLKEKKPQIAADTFIAPSADLLGDVTIGEGSSVWYGCVLRADLQRIIVGCHSNIQDGTVIHNEVDKPVIIGNYVTIGHNATIHGCIIKDRVLVGMGATILSGAVVEEGAVIAAGAVVKENTVIPADCMAAGVPAKIMKTLDANDRLLREEHAEQYEALWRQWHQEKN